jgi:hypothetical protein
MPSIGPRVCFIHCYSVLYFFILYIYIIIIIIVIFLTLDRAYTPVKGLASSDGQESFYQMIQ